MASKRKKGPFRNTANEVCALGEECKQGYIVYATTGRIIRCFPYQGIRDNRTFHMECADIYLALRKGVNPNQPSLFNQQGE
jgi:hypothetical protein